MADPTDVAVSRGGNYAACGAGSRST